jgi:glycosyltransferase involved in cell wall biosynthesis
MELLPLDSPPATDLSVVIPVFNEQDSIDLLLESVDRALTDPVKEPWPTHDSVILPFSRRLRCEIIVVDDGSDDQTVERALAKAPSLRVPLRVIALRRNFGQTAAMQAGIDAAEGELIATLDGDLQNDPADIPRMVDHLIQNDLDLLVGRRQKRKDAVLLRKIPSWIANRLIGKVTGVNLRDYGCSLKIYRASVIKQVRLMGEMHRFIPAWVASVTRPSRIGEIPVTHHARQFGQSKYGISRTIRVLLDLLSVLFFMKFRARPGHFFGTVGLAVGLLGMTMLSVVFASKFALGQAIGTRPMLLMGVFATLSSIQFVCFGVMAEMLSRLHSGGTQPTYFVAETHRFESSPSSGERSDAEPSTRQAG